MGMLREVFVDSFEGDGVEKTIGVACWFFVLMITFCTILFIDSSFAHTEKQKVRVVDKEFVAAHTTFTTQVVGKSTILTPIFHPDSWYVTVSNGGYFSDCKIDEITFSKISSGDIGYAYVGSGLISNQEYCDGFQHINN